MKKVLVLLLIFILAFGSTVSLAEDEPSVWAIEEVSEAIELGFVPEDMQTGYKSNITRAEFAKVSVLFAARQYGMESEEFVNYYLAEHVDGEGAQLTFKKDEFTDIADSEHKYYIEAANSIGIVQGKGDGIFDPDAFITREEAATMLLRTYFCYGSAVKLGAKSAEVDNFSDAQQISSWADTAVRYMYQWDVMKGVSDIKYAPKSNYTREQCYITFLRLYNMWS